MKLNKSQLEAVNHNSGPLLIIAGAGTGKTSVLINRIKNIIEKGWALPDEILALTFTEKSAKEMKERLDVALPYGFTEIEVSTFHSFADRILRQECLYLGLDPNYILMTSSDSYVFFRKNIFDFSLNQFRPLGNPTKFIDEILKFYSRLQDEDVSVEDYSKYVDNLPQLNPEERAYYEEAKELSIVYREFVELKKKESRLDFSDLISILIELFRKKPNILKKYHKKYKYILVDEYQDTNFTQNILVNLISLGKSVEESSEEERSSANITVVGDDDQAIYKFRGAAISNIIQFRTIYPTVKKVVLKENYRSRQEILDAAYKLISNNNPNRLEVTESIDKRLVAKSDFEKSDNDIVKTIVTKFEYQESEEIVKEIKKLVEEDKKYTYSDIAILVRANNHSAELINNFKYYNIPYKFGGNRDLYSVSSIKQLISFLKLVSDYTDDSSFFNLLSISFLNISPKEIIDIFNESKRLKQDIYSTLLYDLDNTNSVIYKKVSKESIENIKKLVSSITEGMRMLKEGMSIGQILFSFFDSIGWNRYLIENADAKNQYIIENISQYFNIVSKFEQSTKYTLFEYLDYLSYSIEKGESPTLENDPFEGIDAVNVMTVHGSKGLEFPVVFMINLVSARFPTNNRSDKFEVPSELIKEYVSDISDREEHLAEERRLFYVGATRAKQLLYLTAATYYGDAKSKKSPSIFVNEILDRDIKKDFDELAKNEDVLRLPVYVSTEPSVVLDYQSLGLKVSSEFSYTQLSTYEDCPRQYKYRYVIGLPSQPSGTLTFGSVFHNSLRTFYDRHRKSMETFDGFVTKPTKEDLLNLFESNWSNRGFKSKKEAQLRLKEGRKNISLYFDKMYKGDEIVLELERKFRYALDDFLIRGSIDRIDYVGMEDGKKLVHVIDYKSGRSKDKKELADQWQIILYSIVAEELLNMKVVKASYWFVEHGETVDIDFNDKISKSIKDRIRGIVAKIRTGDFTPDPSHQCIWCDYKNICEDAVL